MGWWTVFQKVLWKENVLLHSLLRFVQYLLKRREKVKDGKLSMVIIEQFPVS